MQNLQRAARALWNLKWSRLATRSLVASQTGIRDAIRASALSMMGSSSITKRMEFTLEAATVISSTKAEMVSTKGRSNEGGDAWSSPL